jgi:MOSC domain-containing protein YiiM
MMRLISIQVGTPRTVGTPGTDNRMEREFTSAIWKSAVTGPVRVGRLGLAGDSVYDTRDHGGPDQAVLMYAAAHYPRWEQELGRRMEPGAFGENLLVDGLDEDTVCIGDVYRLGPVSFQVSHPRQPCATLARRHQNPDMIAIVRANGRSGWYLRVLVEGSVEAGQPVERFDRFNPEWTVRRAARAMLTRQQNPSDAAALARCQGLSDEWRERLLAAVRAAS